MPGNNAPDTAAVGDSSLITDNVAADADKMFTDVFDSNGAGLPSIPCIDIGMLSFLQDIFKVLLGYMQVISSLSFNFTFVPWPDCVTDTWDAVGVVASFDFFDEFLVTILYPPIIIAGIFGVTRWRRCTTDERAKESILSQGWKVAFFFLFLIYPSVSATVLKIWDCEDIDGTKYLRADY